MNFETSRLHVQTVTRADDPLTDALADILTPSVLAHLPPPLQSVASPQEWLNERLSESQVLSVHHLNAMIGLVMLARFETEVHLGYLFAEHAWGQGFASELIQGLLPALSATGIARVIAGVGAKNPASARVLIKTGFVPAEHTKQDGTTRYEWRTKPG